MSLEPNHQSDIATIARESAIRFQPVVHLLSGDQMGQVCEIAKPMRDTVRFGPVTGNLDKIVPADQFCAHLKTVAKATHGQTADQRPILLPAPAVALKCSKMRQTCHDTIHATSLNSHEVCLEFSDHAFMEDVSTLTSKVQAYRKDGFRIAIDMTSSWQAVLDDALRLLIDTIRIDVDELYASPTLAYVVDAAANAGIFVIAENAKWRDGEYLAGLGVGGAICPQADA